MSSFIQPAFINIGPQEIFIVFLAVILLFGAKKLPELARSMGKSLGEFRKAKDELDREIQAAAEASDLEKKKRAQEELSGGRPHGTVSSTDSSKDKV